MDNEDTPRRANRRERKGAKELLRIGHKAWLYRKDKLTAIEERALKIANSGLHDALKNKRTSAD
ncbi:MAG: hypothetical protein EBY48_00905, partial [Opitutae bacterium]|nr:hypothetical protein [Opitutae bacterium]